MGMSSSLPSDNLSPVDSPDRFWCHSCANAVRSRELPEGDLQCCSCGSTGFIELLENGAERPDFGFQAPPLQAPLEGHAPDTGTRIVIGTAPLDVHSIVEVVRGLFDLNSGMQGLSGTMENPLNQFFMDQITHLIMENDPNRYGSPPTAESVIVNLKKEILTSARAKSLRDCAVCQELFSESDEVHTLTDDAQVCPHAFHCGCIVPWLKEHNSCPVCRFELQTDDPDYERRKRQVRTSIQRHLSQGSPQEPAESSRADSVPMSSQTADDAAQATGTPSSGTQEGWLQGQRSDSFTPEQT
jgi:hypothetical protein